MLEMIIEWYPDEEFLKADGLDDAIIGVEENTMRLIYSVSKVMDILLEEGMTDVDAIDHFNYNIGTAWVGEKTPIWCYDTF